ncbi:MAG: SDR family oxidoreductase [Bacteroidia bacterium]|nr:SDR family oxidoreductase [Bacteroidia bacterium]
MTHILLTGSNGLLGQKIVNKLVERPDVQLTATSRGANRHPILNGYTYHSLDLLDQEAVAHALESFAPDVVIHTAAMTQVDACEDEKETCDAINVGVVEQLAELSAQREFHLVHISTDFIFDGAAGPYSEEAETNPLNYYGHSKLKAENAILESGASAAILRTILLYGITPAMSRSNIVLWVKKSLEAQKPIRVVHDQERSPTLVEDLADASIEAAVRKAKGIYHISGPEAMRVVDIAYRVAEFWKLDKSLISEIDSASLGQKAKRPPITGFIIDKARRELDYKPKKLEEGLAVLDSQLKALSI